MSLKTIKHFYIVSCLYKLNNKKLYIKGNKYYIKYKKIKMFFI